MIDTVFAVIGLIVYLALAVPTVAKVHVARKKACQYSSYLCDPMCGHWLLALLAGTGWPVSWLLEPDSRPDRVSMPKVATGDERKLNREIKSAKQQLALMKLREEREKIYKQIRAREDRMLEG